MDDCDLLMCRLLIARTLSLQVPGVADKTDKATVLEHAVHYLLHLKRCASVNCKDYQPRNPPPVVTKFAYIQNRNAFKAEKKAEKDKEQSEAEVAAAAIANNVKIELDAAAAAGGEMSDPPARPTRRARVSNYKQPNDYFSSDTDSASEMSDTEDYCMMD